MRAIAAAEPAPAAVMTWARGSATFPAAQTPATLVRPVPSVVIQPVVVGLAPQVDEELAVRDEAGRDEERVAGHHAAVGHLDAAESVVLVDDELLDGAFDDADGAGHESGAFGRGEQSGWGEVDEVVGPLTDDLGVADGARSAADDAELAVADLVAVAVGAVQDVAGPPVAQAGNGGQLVAKAGGDQKTPRLDAPPVGQHHPEAVAPVADQVADRARRRSRLRSR